MKITALEIRQKTFEKEFRGLSKAEVSAFLLSLSHAWEGMVEENKSLKSKLETSEKEVQKLREIEDSLFKTLKTAETTGANMVEQANKSAELLMKETKLKAEQLYSDAQQKSDSVVATMQGEIRELEQEFRNIENHRDTLIREIKSFATESLEKVNKVFNERKDLSFIRDTAQNVSSELRNEPIEIPETPQLEVPEPTSIQFEEPTPVVDEVEIKEELENEIVPPVVEENIVEETVSKEDSQKSFFDEITD